MNVDLWECVIQSSDIVHDMRIQEICSDARKAMQSQIHALARDMEPWYAIPIRGTHLQANVEYKKGRGWGLRVNIVKKNTMPSSRFFTFVQMFDKYAWLRPNIMLAIRNNMLHISMHLDTRFERFQVITIEEHIPVSWKKFISAVPPHTDEGAM